MSRTPAPRVLTIGHSDHPVEEFVTLLRRNGITAVADVRSTPYSRLHPDFDREQLAASLKPEGIAYVFLGRELGARTEDESCYEGDRVQYRRMARTALFRAGLDRIRRGMEKWTVALLCAEKEPLSCHRTILVARELEAGGTPVAHILYDGAVETHAQTIERLRALHDLAQPSMFMTREELVEEAYARQEGRIAYVRTDPAAAGEVRE